MIGQAFSLGNKKYNIIILAGGSGSRMGNQSDYIPKALSKLGNKRAIDYIIDKYINVAHKFIIGTSYHSDILQSYVKGNYNKININFSYEKPEDLRNNAISTVYALDLADSRFGTIIMFCDLIVPGNSAVADDSILITTNTTKGKVGTFRHVAEIVGEDKNSPQYIKDIYKLSEPIQTQNGILGTFCLKNTIKLKEIAYSRYKILEDLTDDIISVYVKHFNSMVQAKFCECVYEFGNENDLYEVRKLWEKATF